MTKIKKKIKNFSYIKNFIKKERKLFIFLAVISILILTIPRISDQYLLEIPKPGGAIAEIQIGHPPRFINPVLANTNSDKDLLPLIYSSLLKRNDEGEIIPSIASVALSDNKKVYTINIDKDISFSDGKKLTSDDIIFTIKKIQDPLIRSPYDTQWLEANAEKIDDHTLTITLSKEYAQFESTLASLYILPKHLWFDVSPTEFPFSNLNRKPIGSGPYMVDSIITDSNEKIKKYNFIKNEKYSGEKIFINELSFYFFDSYKDYKKSLIFSDRKIIKNIFSVSSEILSDISSKQSFINQVNHRLSSARSFGLFINKKKNPLLMDNNLRKAISLTIDSDYLIENPLGGYAKDISYTKKTPLLERIKIAKKILEKDFYLKDTNGQKILTHKTSKKEVHIGMALLESNEFKTIAKKIQSDLAIIGINLITTSHKESELISSVIRDRNFEILLFGQETDIVTPDMYYFFHSSQIIDPGINISGFSNSDADKIILELRKNISTEDRKEKMEKLEKLILSNYSYIPLYSPDFIYIMDSRIRNFSKKALRSREERFDSISNWYSQTEKILPVFNNQ